MHDLRRVQIVVLMLILLFCGFQDLTSQDRQQFISTRIVSSLLENEDPEEAVSEYLQKKGWETFLELLDLLSGLNEESARTVLEGISDYGSECSVTTLRLLFPSLGEKMSVGKVWTRRAVAAFLHEAGGAARPAMDVLIKGLQDEDVEVREWCISALVFMEYLEPFEVVPAVLPLLNDTSDEVVECALGLLKEFRMAPGSAMERLMKIAGKHPDEFVRSTALETLCAVDPADKKVRKALHRALRDRDCLVRATAIELLFEFRPVGESALRAIRQCALHDETSLVRHVAIEGLVKSRLLEDACFGKVLGVLKAEIETERRHRTQDIEFLMELLVEMDDPAATSLLLNFARHEDLTLSVSACKVLVGWPGRPEEAWPLIGRIFERQSIHQIENFAGFCGTALVNPTEFGKSLIALGPASIPAMKELLDSKSGFVRYRAIQVIGRIHPRSMEAALVLVDALDETYSLARKEGLEQLRDFEPFGTLAARKLSRLAADRRYTSSERLDFLETLSEVGGPQCLPALLRIVEDPDHEEKIRVRALRALVELGKEGAALTIMLLMQDVETPAALRREAVGLLPAAGHPVDPFMNELIKAASQDVDQDLKQAAFLSLAKVDSPKVRDFFIQVLENMESDDYLPDEFFGALAQVRPDPLRVMPLLLERLVDEDGDPDEDILEVFKSYGDLAAPAVPMLIELLEKNSWYGIELAGTLYKIAPSLTVEPLIRLLKGTEEWPPEPEAASMLVTLQVDPDRVLPLLRRVIQNAGTGEADAFCPALVRLGARGRPAVPDIIDAVLEERMHYLDGALTLGVLLEGSKKPPLIFRKILIQLDPQEDQEEIEWILRAEAAIMGDEECSRKIRSWMSSEWY